MARGTAVCAVSALTLALFLACRDETDPPASATPSETTTTPTAETSPATRIMPLGDSITQADADHDSYRRPLWQRLEASGARVDFVGSQRRHHRGEPPHADFDIDHEGHWGWRVDEVLEHIDGWMEDAQPDVVLIHLGSNDLFQRQGVPGTLEELSALVDTLRASVPGVRIVMAQIIPTTTAATNARIEALNARLPSLAASKSIRLVDHFTDFDAFALTYDGVHPNVSGEARMAERWLESLLPLLDETE